MCDDIDATVDELRAKAAQFYGLIEEHAGRLKSNSGARCKEGPPRISVEIGDRTVCACQSRTKATRRRGELRRTNVSGDANRPRTRIKACRAWFGVVDTVALYALRK